MPDPIARAVSLILDAWQRAYPQADLEPVRRRLSFSGSQTRTDSDSALLQVAAQHLDLLEDPLATKRLNAMRALLRLPSMPAAPEKNYSLEAYLQAAPHIAQARANAREIFPDGKKFRPIEIRESAALAAKAGANRLAVVNAALDGSFKWRGAVHFLMSIAKEISIATGRPFRGVAEKILAVVYSHGNHANGVGDAVQVLGFGGMVVVMPSHEQTQRIKIRKCLERGDVVILHGDRLEASRELAVDLTLNGLEATFTDQLEYRHGSLPESELDELLRSGKTVVLYGTSRDLTNQSPEDRNRYTKMYLQQGFAQEHADREDLNLTEPYNNEFISVGQGTIGMELAMQFPDILTGAWHLMMPVGGGGLLAGLFGALQYLNPELSVTAFNSYETSVFARFLLLQDFARALREEEIAAPETDKAADGTDVPRLGQIPASQLLKRIREFGAKIGAARVSEREIREAMAFGSVTPWFGGEAMAYEGAFGSLVAGILNGAVRARGENLVLVNSGVNLDRAKLDRYKAESPWIEAWPEFFDFTCAVRSAIRGGGDNPFEEAQIEAFNDLLARPESLLQLQGDFRSLPPADAMESALKRVAMEYHASKRRAKDLMGIEEIPLQDVPVDDGRKRVVQVPEGEGEPRLDDLRDPQNAFVRQLRALDPEQPVVFGSKTGRSARVMAWIAQLSGFRQVYVLKGGKAAEQFEDFLRDMRDHDYWQPVGPESPFKFRDGAGQVFEAWLDLQGKLRVDFKTHDTVNDLAGRTYVLGSKFFNGNVVVRGTVDPKEGNGSVSGSAISAPGVSEGEAPVRTGDSGPIGFSGASGPSMRASLELGDPVAGRRVSMLPHSPITLPQGNLAVQRHPLTARDASPGERGPRAGAYEAYPARRSFSRPSVQRPGRGLAPARQFSPRFARA